MSTALQEHATRKFIVDIDREIDALSRQILENKVLIARLRLCKTKKNEAYNFLCRQSEADDLLKIMTRFPQIVSGRQLQILYFISQYKSNKEIAELLFIAEATVKYHKTDIFRKLGVRSEKELTRRYIDIENGTDVLPVARHLDASRV